MTRVGAPPPAGTAAVELSGTSWGYDGAPVLRDVSLTVAPGEFLGVVGPSGSGKSTLIRALTGRSQLLSGSAHVFGHIPGTTGANRHVGYVPQLGTIDPTAPLTVERLALQGLTRGATGLPWVAPVEREQVRAVLDRLDIAHLARRPLGVLSGGELQRALLARALLREPDLLLLDEPTSGVDLQTRHEVLHLLGRLHGEGVTILLTTHDLNFVAAHLPRIICLQGTVVADGPPLDVFTGDVIRQTYGAEVRIVHQDGLVFVADPTHILTTTGHHDEAAHGTGVER